MARPRRGGSNPLGGRPPALRAPSACQSVYTVVVSAAWPKKLVDPSKDALFNTNANPGAAGVYQSPHYATLRKWLGMAPEFPGCLAKYPALVASLTKQGARFKWYTYYSVDTATLGQIQFPLVWNWSAKNKTVDYAGTPVAAWGKVTKYWIYEYTLPSKPGETYRGACVDTRTVRMTTVLAAGGNRGAAGLKPNQFTIEIAWWLPFDPEGVVVDTEGSLGDQIAEYGAALLQKLAAAGSAAAEAVYEKYEAMPVWQKFALGLACGMVAEGLVIKGVVAAPELIAELIGTELPEGTAAFMEARDRQRPGSGALLDECRRNRRVLPRHHQGLPGDERRDTGQLQRHSVRGRVRRGVPFHPGTGRVPYQVPRHQRGGRTQRGHDVRSGGHPRAAVHRGAPLEARLQE